MKKLRIQLDELRVESFATDGPSGERGTVAAHARDTDPRVCQYTEDWRCSQGYGCRPGELLGKPGRGLRLTPSLEEPGQMKELSLEAADCTVEASCQRTCYQLKTCTA